MAAENNLIKLDTFEAIFTNAKKAVFKITNPSLDSNSGSGFFIQFSLTNGETVYGIMTAQHVIEMKVEDQTLDVTEFSIEFETLPVLNKIALKDFPLIYWSEDMLDAAFYFLDANYATDLMKSGAIFLQHGKANIGDFVFSIQFPKDKTGSIQNKTGSIQFGTIVKELGGYNMIHSIPTDQGSAGSPLINGKGQVVGIHRGKYIPHTVESSIQETKIGPRIECILEGVSLWLLKQNLTSISGQSKELDKDEVRKTLKELGLVNKEANLYYLSEKTSGIETKADRPYAWFKQKERFWYWTSGDLSRGGIESQWTIITGKETSDDNKSKIPEWNPEKPWCKTIARVQKMLANLSRSASTIIIEGSTTTSRTSTIVTRTCVFL